MTTRAIRYRAPIIFTLLLALSPVSNGLSAQELGSPDFGYGFYRTVEGQVVLAGLDDDEEPFEVEANYPVMVGDRLWVAERSRLEAVLPDKSVIRIGERSEIVFEALAGSADAVEGTATVVRIGEGEVQLTSEVAPLSDEPVEIEAANARIYLELPGTYRLITDGREWTEVLVRDGFAEIATDRGSVVARPGESVEVSGELRPDVDIATAGPLDELERWGGELSGDRLAHSDYVDESLTYAAAPLDDAGAWVSVSGRTAWRPRVRVGWRPFTDGWWTYTPSGLSWVAYEPWGWVTSHYGAWDYVSGYGWLWFPGTVYSPAWVYWYWGPTHTAWIPAGYYSRYYGSRFGAGFRFGVYGWAGGYWDSWSHWTFCPTRYFGHRSYRSYWRSGHDMYRDRRLRAVPRGVITTDTRDLTPRRWGKPSEIVDVLQRRHQGRAGVTRTLGDVTPFVERRSDLPETTKRMIFTERSATRSGALPGRTQRRVAGFGDDVATSPWRVERPDARRARGDAPSMTRSPAARSATDWELIERLRRFENKQQGVSGRSRSMEGSGSPDRRLDPFRRPEMPTRRILDEVRSRSPRATDDRRFSTTRPPTTRSPSSSWPSMRRPTGDRPTTSTTPPQRPSMRSTSPQRPSVRSTPQRPPATTAPPTSTRARSMERAPSASSPPPRSGGRSSVGSSRSGSSRSMSSSGSRSSSRPESSGRSSARKRDG